MIRIEDIGAAAAIVDQRPDGSFAIRNLNAAAERLSGLVAADVVGRPVRDVFGPETGEHLEASYRACLTARSSVDVEREISLPRGQIETRTTLTPLCEQAESAPLSLLAITVDITAQSRLVEDLKRANARLAVAMEALGGGHWYFDARKGEFEFSAALQGIMGPTAPAIVSVEQWQARVHPDDRTDTCFIDILAGRLEQGSHDFRVLAGDEEVRWVRCRRRAVVEADKIVGVAGFMVDVTQDKRREAELSQQAATDSLTGLINRRKFDAELIQDREMAVENGVPLSLLMVDVDHFKSYNDTYGHVAGDTVLRRLARCLSSVAKAHGGTAARYGGEEFAVLLPGHDVPASARVAEAALRCVRDLGEVHECSPTGLVSVSIGVASQPGQRSAPPIDLVAQADAALYRAKRNGRGCYRIMLPPHLSVVNAETSSAA